MYYMTPNTRTNGGTWINHTGKILTFDSFGSVMSYVSGITRNVDSLIDLIGFTGNVYALSVYDDSQHLIMAFEIECVNDDYYDSNIDDFVFKSVDDMRHYLYLNSYDRLHRFVKMD